MLYSKILNLKIMLDSRLRSDGNTEPTRLRSSGHTKPMCRLVKKKIDILFTKPHLISALETQ